jgi:hypothetical protein
LYHPRSNVYFAATDPEDADAVQCGCGLLAGVAMVALQCMVVVGASTGTFSPACGSSDQCHQAGTYCEVGATNRCGYCGDPILPPQTDPATGGTLNNPDAPDFAGFNLTAVAELCANPSLYTRSPLMARAIQFTASAVVSWCKSGSKALDLFIPFFWQLVFKVMIMPGSQAKPAFTPSTVR